MCPHSSCPDSAEILDIVRRTVIEYDLFSGGDRVVAACSGGADSTALLALLVKLKPEWELDLSVAHFNHGLRKAAAGDEGFVRDLADRFSLPFYPGGADVRAYAGRQRLNLEEAARELRYAFLKETARRLTRARIAVGHTLDDQAETVLMRLMRGSGSLGLTGIWPVVEGVVVRPLLGLRRSDVMRFLRAEGLTFRLDESNRDRRYLRNRIRLDVLPFIRERLGQDIVPPIGRLADILRAEEAWLSGLVEEAARKAIVSEGGRPVLRFDRLESFPAGLKRRLVREYIRRLTGHTRGLTLEEVDAVTRLKNGGRVSLKGRLLLRREGPLILPVPAEPPRPGFSREWDGTSPLRIPEAGLEFSARILSRVPEDELHGDNRTRIFLDRERLRFPLTVRSRRPGDAYQPLGAPGRKRVKEILRAAGVPLRMRGRIPVFTCGGEIVWIFGLPVAEAFKVTATTSGVLAVECRGIGGIRPGLSMGST